MSLLVETIKCREGRLMNLMYHQERLNRTRKALFGLGNELRLHEIIHVPEAFSKGLFRCRLIYGEDIRQIEFHPHSYRPVKSLRLINCANIEYSFKYTDRQLLEQLFAKRGNCDDILIVKNGYVTDSYTANVVFSDGSRWWTPDTPLLPGTQRARLIEEKKIKVCRITPEDISQFDKAGLINAMQDLDAMPVVAIANIHYQEP